MADVKYPIRCLHYLSAVRLAEGGVVRAVLDLCGALAAAGHEVILLTGDNSDVPAAWQVSQRGVPSVVHLPQRGLARRFARSDIPSLRRLVAANDVLHLHTPWDPANAQMAHIARREDKPYLLSPHGMLDDWSMAQKQWKKRAFLFLGGSRLIKQAAVVHCTAAGELRQARRYFPHNRGHVLPLIFDTNQYHHLPGIEIEERFSRGPS